MSSNIGRIINLFVLFIELRVARSLVTESTEMIQTDTSMIGDEFHWLDEKRVELSTVDAEDRLAAFGEFQVWAKDLAMEEGGWVYNDYADIRAWAKEQWVEAGRDLDKSLSYGRYDEETVVLWGDTRDEFKAVNYLVHFVPKWTEDYGYQMEYIKSMEWDLSQTSDDEDDRMRYYWPADYNEACEQMDLLRPKMSKMLLKAKKRIFECKKNWSYDLYVKGMLIVLKEISEKLNADTPLYEKFQSMQFQLDSVNSSSVREESSADMGLQIEYAIDMKWAAERLSYRHNMSTEETFLMLQATEEGTGDF